MTKEQLNTLLAEEKTLYLGTDRKRRLKMRLSAHKRYYIWRAIAYFRMAQFYNAVRTNPAASLFKRRFAKLAFRYYDHKRNRSGALAGIEIGLGSTLGRGINIWHGGVIVNGILGDHCILHGNNVIGNKKSGDKTATPVIGSNVDIGAGAIIIGGVEIADQCIIGAGAVVTRSFEKPGCVLAGVPAKELAKKGENE